ncbi:TadE/TadG family type IV pilus assembly protein [Thermaurantiacus sp.]
MQERQSALRFPRPRPQGRDHQAELLKDERGVAALELALTLPLLTVLLLGAADLAITAARARQVEALTESAAKAVVRLAGDLLPPLRARSQISGLATSGQPGVQQGPGLAPLPTIRITELVDLPANVTAAVRVFRGCPGDQGIGEAAEARCPDGSPPAAFAEIRMQAPVDRLVDWPSALLPPSVEAKSLVRLD